MCVSQTAGTGSGGEGDPIAGPVQLDPDCGQEPEGTLPCLGLCQKELGHTGSKVSMTQDCADSQV